MSGAAPQPLACLPAIDLRAGRCVRLLQGDFAAETVYGDPLEQALSYVEQGADALHLVDLDAARTGMASNRAIAMEIARKVPVPVQLGGGFRSEQAVQEALGSGIARVVLGTAGVQDPELARRLAEAHPGRIVLGLDHRRVAPGKGEPEGRGRSGREVALRGWLEGSGVDLLDALDAARGAPLAGVVVTDIGADGTLAGPDLDGYRLALAESELAIFASGGVGTTADLVALAALEVDGRRLAGVVVGRALLSGAMTLAEAVAACAR
ncbi:MAG: 1-(5-phosphoribosyl)-5-[(5-phosphoribosylamino)methylideneamino] imidazole-4-carboxamide isomerase [Acidimicrobiaceae bacterium]|nr:1-(5-phosphoribosyl)-5-[(5-phosphoribosylamino)methylideneamino] imidazole-4-carboxamide isomerase [Acidimicrobiaceae bacterium]